MAARHQAQERVLHRRRDPADDRRRGEGRRRAGHGLGGLRQRRGAAEHQPLPAGRTSRRVRHRDADAVVLPPPFVAADAVLERAVVGPYASIGAGAVVRDAVVRDAIVEDGATVESAVVEHAIVGRRARGAGPCRPAQRRRRQRGRAVSDDGTERRLARAGGRVRPRGGRAGQRALRPLRLQRRRRRSRSRSPRTRTATTWPSTSSRPVTVRTFVAAADAAPETLDEIRRALWHLGRLRHVGELVVAERARGGLGQRLEGALPRPPDRAAGDGPRPLARLPGRAGRGRGRARSGDGLRHRSPPLDPALPARAGGGAATRADASSTSAPAPASWPSPRPCSAPARVDAVDIEPVAVRAARENAARNGVAERVRVAAGQRRSRRALRGRLRSRAGQHHRPRADRVGAGAGGGRRARRPAGPERRHRHPRGGGAARRSRRPG